MGFPFTDPFGLSPGERLSIRRVTGKQFRFRLLT